MKTPEAYTRSHPSSRSHVLVKLVWVLMLTSIALLFGVVFAANAEDKPLIWSTISDAPTSVEPADAPNADSPSASAEEQSDVIPTLEPK